MRATCSPVAVRFGRVGDTVLLQPLLRRLSRRFGRRRRFPWCATTAASIDEERGAEISRHSQLAAVHSLRFAGLTRLSSAPRCTTPFGTSTVDICQLICDDHHEQRRRFAILDQIDRSDAETLAALWDRLATFLEVHAASEKKHFYPALLHVGEGAGDKDTPAAETRDAISDHNDIRDAVSKVAGHAVGSDDWYAAIAVAREANSDHMADEERASLADFRRHANLQQRHQLAVAFATFEAQHFSGVNAKNRNVGSYISIHQ